MLVTLTGNGTTLAKQLVKGLRTWNDTGDLTPFKCHFSVGA